MAIGQPILVIPVIYGEVILDHLREVWAKVIQLWLPTLRQVGLLRHAI